MVVIGLVLVSGFVLVGCPSNDNEQTYTVTVGSLKNGSITANPTSGVEGTEITLTVNPNDLYRLKAGTLKYGSTVIDETLKFNLPADNVTITGEFESLFIGAWNRQYAEAVLTFFENGTWTGHNLSDGKFRSKGTWITETPNNFSLTITHVSNPEVEAVEDLSEVESYIEDYTVIELTNSILRLEMNNYIHVYTKIDE